MKMPGATKYLSAALAAALVLAAGCRSPNSPSGPGEIWDPPEWEKDSQADDPVWAALREKKFDSSRPLTLADCLKIALRNNPSSRKAWQETRGAEAELKQARSQWYPTLTLSGEASYLKQNFKLKNEELPDPDTDQLTYGPNLKITYLLLDLGGRSGAIEEALQQLLAANYEFNRSIQDLLLDVEKAYHGFYSSRAGLDAARADLRDSETGREAARQKFKVGLVSKLDELQAQSSYDESLYELEAAREAFKTARAAVARVIGLPADAEFEIQEPSNEPPGDISRAEVSELIEEGMRKRPDIAALRATLRAKEAAVKAAASELWPDLSVGGEANKYWYQYYGENEPYEDSYEYSGYLSIGWEIFSGFSNLNRKRAAAAEAEAVREELREAELAASAEVWTQYYAFNAAVGKYKSSRALLASAQASYDLALEGYKTGLKSILDLLTAQSRLSGARSKLIGSRKDVFIALAELAHATGSLGIEKTAGGAEVNDR